MNAAAARAADAGPLMHLVGGVGRFTYYLGRRAGMFVVEERRGGEVLRRRRRKTEDDAEALVDQWMGLRVALEAVPL